MSQPQTSFVAAYRLDGQGGGEALDNQALQERWQHDDGQLWMHLDFSFDDVNTYLHDIAALHEDVIEALVEEDTRPRVARFSGGLVTTLRGVNLNPGSAPEDMLSLRVWITPNRLITLRRRPLQSVLRVREYLHAGEGARNVAELLAGMADAIIDRVGDLSHRIDTQLGELEENQLNDIDIDGDDLTRVRRPLITLRRFMEPQSHCLSKLAEDTSGLDETARLWLRESANLLYRYVEDFNAMQERALILQEQIWNEHNERLNERMYLMAIMTAIFLPLTFLTGLLGINVGGIPGAESPLGFVSVVFLSLLVGAGVMAVLKRWHWW
ncbi:zinc transporter ZntB [Phytohalomonas tamaricis]|uniref:zinc transporter ZntB n=1 Tax=Phytohalomonas tamaricis TaxID=2081032 RepID=UPI000D0BCB91|nr:zinc transporter ZntB [Phytohalomonas tamaricis]